MGATDASRLTGRVKHPPAVHLGQARELANGAIGAVIVLTLLGAALRFATLDAQSLFLDETVTADLLDRGLGGTLGALSDSESAPPLYYLLAWGWSHVWGFDEVALRSLSALLGTAMIPVAGAAATLLTTRRIGLVTAAMVALNPLLVWYSQEARVYALFALMAALSLLAFAAVLRAPTRRRIALWGLVSVLAVATHYFAAFLFLPQAIMLARRHLDRRTLYASIGAVLAAAAALLPLALEQRSVGTDWLIENPLIERLADTGVQFLVGPGVPAPVLLGPVAAVIAGFGVWLLITRGTRTELGGARTFALVGIPAIAAPLVISLGVDVFLQKAMIGAWLPLAIVPAAGFGARRAGRIGLGALAALGVVWLVVVVAVASTPNLQRDDWRGAAEALGSDPRERVLLVNPADAGPPHEQAIRYYIPEAEPTPLGAPAAEIDLLTLNDNGLDAQIRGVPELPEIPNPPGFQLREQIDTDRYTLFRFEAPDPRSVGQWAREVRGELEAAGRGPTLALRIPPDSPSLTASRGSLGPRR